MCRFLWVLGLAALFISAEGISGVIDCEPLTTGTSGKWPTLNTPFELNISQVNAAANVNTTVGSGISDYTVLYSISRVNVGNTSATCNSRPSNQVAYYTMLSANGASVNTIGNDVIYPTSVPGIGISLVTTSFSGPGQTIALYPVKAIYADGGNSNGMWVAIKIWKIPGVIPAFDGPITFIGPTVAEFLSSAGNTYTSSDPARLLDNGNGWISSSRVLTGTLMFQPTTCNLQMENKTVQMGTYDASRGDKSAWKDASFKLACPDAYGYGGSTYSNDGFNYPNSVAPNSTITANSIKNNPLRIQIQPYTQVIDAAQGIIGLDSSGAEGYGIQLAWGDAATLGSGTPTSPVQLNSWTYASTLNPAAYRSTAYAIGSKAITSGQDGTIKMAARYIRTTGATAPGPANAAVEVLANYE